METDANRPFNSEPRIRIECFLVAMETWGTFANNDGRNDVEKATPDAASAHDAHRRRRHDRVDVVVGVAGRPVAGAGRRRRPHRL